MTQTIEKYLEIGQPILVVTHDDWLVPYELQKTNMTGKSSGITHKTPELFRSCLERILCIPFKKSAFQKTSRGTIAHLGFHMDFDEKVYAIPDQTFYLYKRIAREVVCEISGEVFPLKKYSELTEDELKEELASLPKRNIDLAFQTLHSIQLSAQSDAIGERARIFGQNSTALVLYEIQFTREGVNPGIDIYFEKKEKENENL